MSQKCPLQRHISWCSCGWWWWTILCVTCLSTSTVNSKANLENDAHLDTVGLIRKHRYPVKQFSVLTKDGFLLNLVRIPLTRSIPRTFKTQPGPPVLLVHGILSSADDWVLNSPWNSPGFLLSDAGYDVWLLNTRGTPYSAHLKYHRDNKKFWDFSFDDIGVFDIPAVIDFILQHTGYSQLTIVGWSQGSTDVMVTLSLKPQYNHKVKLFVALAPVANITHLASPMTMLIPFKGFIKKTVDELNGGGVFPSSRRTRSMYNHFCNSHLRGLCFLPVSVNIGISPHQLNRTRIPIYMAHMPAGTSTKNLVHFVQNRRRKDFCRYDYGEHENLRRYGSPFPPKYPLSKMSAPVALFWGKGDRLATPKDVSTLRRELSHTIIYDYLVPQPDFAHLDFTIGIDANRILHNPVIHVINRFHKGLHLGLYRPEHDTLFHSPVPPFPLPPMTHKNPSGLPIMGIKVASMLAGKPWNGHPHGSVADFAVAPQQHPSAFPMLAPPPLGTTSLKFAEDTFASLGEEIRPHISNILPFTSHHNFGISPSHYVLNTPMFVPQLPSISSQSAFADNSLQNNLRQHSGNNAVSRRPPPVRDLMPQRSPSSEHTSKGNRDFYLPPLKAPGNVAYVTKGDGSSVEASQPLLASGHSLSKGQNNGPIIMHPDSNGGFQTDWFAVGEKSKKLSLHVLMPLTNPKQSSAQVPASSNTLERKSTIALRTRDPHKTVRRVAKQSRLAF